MTTFVKLLETEGVLPKGSEASFLKVAEILSIGCLVPGSIADQIN